MDFLNSVWAYFFSSLFFQGAVTTLVLTLVSEFGGIVIGLILAIAQTTRFQPAVTLSRAYIWLFRGTPALLQLIFVYNALPQAGIRFSGLESAVIALSMNEGAYMAEIIRSGIEAVSKGQRSAARALGMHEWQVMRYVVLPQAVRVITPPVGNQFIGMLKLSALVSVIGVTDLLLTAQEVASANFQYVNTLIAAALYYLILTTIFTILQGYAERRMDISRRRKTVVTEYR